MAGVYTLIDLDDGIVGCELQEDPLNPRYVLHQISALALADIRNRNLPDNQKWTLLAFVSLIAFLRFVIQFQHPYNKSCGILHLRPRHLLH